MSGKTLTPYCPCLSSSDGYLVERKKPNYKLNLSLLGTVLKFYCTVIVKRGLFFIEGCELGFFFLLIDCSKSTWVNRSAWIFLLHLSFKHGAFNFWQIFSPHFSLYLHLPAVLPERKKVTSDKRFPYKSGPPKSHS